MTDGPGTLPYIFRQLLLEPLPAAAVAKIFVTRAVQYYRTTALFLQAPPDAVTAQNLARHTGITDMRPAEQDHDGSTTPRGRES